MHIKHACMHACMHAPRALIRGMLHPAELCTVLSWSEAVCPIMPVSTPLSTRCSMSGLIIAVAAPLWRGCYHGPRAAESCCHSQESCSRSAVPTVKRVHRQDGNACAQHPVEPVYKPSARYGALCGQACGQAVDAPCVPDGKEPSSCSPAGGGAFTDVRCKSFQQCCCRADSNSDACATPCLEPAHLQCSVAGTAWDCVGKQRHAHTAQRPAMILQACTREGGVMLCPWRY